MRFIDRYKGINFISFSHRKPPFDWKAVRSVVLTAIAIIIILNYAVTVSCQVNTISM